jgi:hypothetical protein
MIYPICRTFELTTKYNFIEDCEKFDSDNIRLSYASLLNCSNIENLKCLSLLYLWKAFKGTDHLLPGI